MPVFRHLSAIPNQKRQILFCAEHPWTELPHYVVVSDKTSPVNAQNVLVYDQANRELGDLPRASLPLLRGHRTVFLGHFSAGDGGLQTQGSARLSLVRQLPGH
jgi:hypothetical protein